MKKQLFDYLYGNAGALSLETILLNFLFATFLGVVIYFSYKLAHTGGLYSARFNISLFMLTLVTTLVMNVIGNNIALSLGMVGALSIVRFRTAIKDSRDTSYIFWCIAVGICCGVSEYLVAGIGSAFIFIFLLVFGAVKDNDRYLIIINAKASSADEIENVMTAAFKSKERLKVKNKAEEKVEYIYEVSHKLLSLLKGENEITNQICRVKGVSSCNVVSQSDDITA